jgi:hypothetical protein
MEGLSESRHPQLKKNARLLKPFSFTVRHSDRDLRLIFPLVIYSNHTVSVLKSRPSFGQCSPFQSERTVFTMVAQNLNRSA